LVELRPPPLGLGLRPRRLGVDPGSRSDELLRAQGHNLDHRPGRHFEDDPPLFDGIDRDLVFAEAAN